MPRLLSKLSHRLYVISALTDFAAFIVVFTVSRSLKEGGADPLRLGFVGAGLALTQGIGSALGGWLAHRFDGKTVFLAGAAVTLLTCGCALLIDLRNPAFLAGYWLLGIGLGWLYPPLIGWLNHGDDAHRHRHQVSRRLILFCISWNLGMMCGQLTAGTLFDINYRWGLLVALAAAAVNLVLVATTARPLAPQYESPLADSGEASPPGQPAVMELAPLELAVAFKRLSWIANLGGMFGGSLVLHLLSDLAVTIGVTARQHGWLLACSRGVVIATYVLMHKSQRWHYRFSAALASQALAAVGLLFLADAESALGLLAGLVLLGQLMGYNYFAGLYYSTAGSAHVGRAFAAGMHEATLAAGIAIGTLVGGILGTQVGHRAPYLMAAAAMAMSAIAQIAAYRRWVHPLRSLN